MSLWDKPPPTLGYQSQQKAARLRPKHWWVVVNLACFLLMVIVLFAIEPERSIDPPAPQKLELLVDLAAACYFGTGVAAIVSWISDFRRRKRL